MTREDIDRIATEYLNDTESEFEMQDVIELADKALILKKAIEDIKAEIQKEISMGNHSWYRAGMEHCLEIIERKLKNV